MESENTKKDQQIVTLTATAEQKEGKISRETDKNGDSACVKFLGTRNSNFKKLFCCA